MAKRTSPLIVALDVETFEEAMNLIAVLGDAVDIYKVGSQLFTACGPVIVRHILAQNKKVFLDLKFHDIPHTVAKAVAAAVGLSAAVHEVLDQEKKPRDIERGIFMLTLHTLGGEEMLKQAVQSAITKAKELRVAKPLMVGVTVLTSQKKEDNIRDIVLERARLAKACGLDGVVASAQEAASIRRAMGKDFIIVTPGIRPAGGEKQDQNRVMTPAQAIKNGSHFLVVGRPIIEAREPKRAAEEIIKEITPA